MKLGKLYIDDYKMFKDFDISFVDENDEALPIIVLAGVNGSGKTTLLESMIPNEILNQNLFVFKKNNFILKLKTDKTLKEEEKKAITIYDPKCFSEHLTELKNDIAYFPSEEIDIFKVEELFVKYWYNQVKFHNKRNDEITKNLQKFIIESFSGLDLAFAYSHIDENDNIFFQNNLNEKFKINELSTGEQTLLSKVLYLFLKEYKDKVILIDEPELSLHPSWQNKVLKIYENFALKNNCQIIIATHSPHIIGSAKPSYLRVLKKVEDKIEVMQYTQSYGLEFSQILTDIMGVDYLRTPEVAKKLESIKTMIVEEKYDSEEFQSVWKGLEEMLGKNYLDLKLLKLEIASRRKNASNN